MGRGHPHLQKYEVERLGFGSHTVYLIIDTHWHAYTLHDFHISLSWRRVALVFAWCLRTHRCTEISTTTRLSLQRGKDACGKCGTVNKSGKLSCCAHGGAWFKHCGGAGKTKVAHTWVDGVEACEGFVTSVDTSLKVTPQRHAEVIAYMVNASKTLNAIQYQKNTSGGGDMFNVDATACRDWVGRANVVFALAVYLSLYT